MLCIRIDERERIGKRGIKDFEGMQEREEKEKKKSIRKGEMFEMSKGCCGYGGTNDFGLGTVELL